MTGRDNSGLEAISNGPVLDVVNGIATNGNGSDSGIGSLEASRTETTTEQNIGEGTVLLSGGSVDFISEDRALVRSSNNYHEALVALSQADISEPKPPSVRPAKIPRALAFPASKKGRSVTVRLKPTYPVLEAFLNDKSGPEGEDDGVNPKDVPYLSLVKLYGQHPTVLSALEGLKKKESIVRSVDDPVRNYLENAGQYNLLSRADEARLFTTLDKAIEVLTGLESLDGISAEDEQLLLDGAIAYSTIYLSNLRLVVSIASRGQARTTIDQMDLIAESNFGLAAAIARFDVKKGFKFSTYATSWIKQAKNRAIAKQARVIRVPNAVHDAYTELQRAVYDLLSLGTSTSDANLARETGFDREKVRKLRMFGPYEQRSLNEPLMGGQAELVGNDTELGDLIPEQRDSIEVAIDQLVAREEVVELFNSFDETQKYVVSLRTGIHVSSLNGTTYARRDGTSITYEKAFAQASEEGGRTFRGVGEILGVSRERIRQIEEIAYKRARESRLSRK